AGVRGPGADGGDAADRLGHAVDHRPRRHRVAAGAVAELAVVVLAPAVHAAVALERAAMSVADGELGHAAHTDVRHAARARGATQVARATGLAERAAGVDHPAVARHGADAQAGEPRASELPVAPPARVTRGIAEAAKAGGLAR